MSLNEFINLLAALRDSGATELRLEIALHVDVSDDGKTVIIREKKEEPKP